jgi:hypothetical protein
MAVAAPAVLAIGGGILAYLALGGDDTENKTEPDETAKNL